MYLSRSGDEQSGSQDSIDFEEGLGMTASRQAEVRSALYSMLGDNTAGRQQGVRRETDTSHGTGNTGSPNVDCDANERVRRDRQTGPASNVGEQWSCGVCTLLNDSCNSACVACGCSHLSE